MTAIVMHVLFTIFKLKSLIYFISATLLSKILAWAIKKIHIRRPLRMTFSN